MRSSLIAFVLCPILMLGASEAPLPEAIWFVDGAGGVDSNEGHAEAPLATIAQALKRLAAHEGPGRIVVAAGTYREGGLRIAKRSWPVVLECRDGEAVISGADVVSAWKRVGQLYRAEWTERWGSHGYEDFPKGETACMDPLGGRCEMVFWNGALLTQVAETEALVPGSFTVSEEDQAIWLKAPRGERLRAGTVEVAVRRNLLTVFPLPGLTLRGLHFTRAASGAQHDGLDKYTVLLAGEHAPGDVDTKTDRDFLRNVRIENCRFTWNNSAGLTMANIVGLNVRQSTFDDNGAVVSGQIAYGMCATRSARSIGIIGAWAAWGMSTVGLRLARSICSWPMRYSGTVNSSTITPLGYGLISDTKISSSRNASAEATGMWVSTSKPAPARSPCVNAASSATADRTP
jgi:hypothetical protein